MLQRFVVLITIALTAFPALSDDKAPTPLTIYTEENPPFSYTGTKGTDGLYVDLVLALFKTLDIDKAKQDITVVPWARAYNETRLRPNSMLFSVVRTPDREAFFKWVGPIGEYRSVLYARKERQLKLGEQNGLQDLKIGVTKDSRGEQFLKAAGATSKNLIYLNSPESAAHMLARGRIDAWSRDFTVAHWTITELGYNGDDFEVIHTFDVQQRYIAFNKDSDLHMIARMQRALDTFRSDGTLAAITKRQSSDRASGAPINTPN